MSDLLQVPPMTREEHVAALKARPRLVPEWRAVTCKCGDAKPCICPVHGFAPALGEVDHYA